MDTDAFDAFYAGSFSRIVGQLYAMCGDFSEAQDCTQEAFVRAWDRRAQLTRAPSPQAWVRTTAWRLCVSRWRRARLALRPPDRARSAAPPVEPDVTHTALMQALRQIPAEQRRAVVLHHICDLSVSEIAAETGVPTGTVKARLSRGRAALAALLRDPADEENSHA